MYLIMFHCALAGTGLLLLLERKYLWISTSLLTAAIALITGFWSVTALRGSELVIPRFFALMGIPVSITIDSLSAFFILVISFTALTGTLYARKYLEAYREKKNDMEMRLHYFNLIWLYISMLLVCMLRDFVPFLVAWELMSLSSFFLVMFEGEKEEVMKGGLKYLVQMHIGFFFLLGAVILLSSGPQSIQSFDRIGDYLQNHAGLPLFLLFFAGFGIKAGFIPLHSWLPQAHPAAPTHVSGIMSGVMIKVGIYGILRVLIPLKENFLVIGGFLLGISIISGLLGVMYAIVQHDFKKLLAYHSIENIGIIGIGLGGGLIGIALGNPLFAFLSFTGGILHILNHSLFKSLLFFSSGSVYLKTHTRNIEELGGVFKKMPYTGLLFLIGAAAICGLPPFNGFISEFLIYSGFFQALISGYSKMSIPALISILSLALIGGLALFCFAKVFGVIFLGTPRSGKAESAKETDFPTNLILSLTALLIAAIGLVPALFIRFAGSVTSLYIPLLPEVNEICRITSQIARTSLIFLTLTALLLFLRGLQQKSVSPQPGPIWGCGYSGADPALHQYTATSFADNYTELIGPIIPTEKEFEPLKEEEIFPETRTFATHSADFFDDKLYSPAVRFLLGGMKRLALFQSGKVQHYILYAFLFIALVTVLILTGGF